MARLRDVAEAAGVSISTASLVLGSNRTGKPVGADLEERVRKAAKKLGYVANAMARSFSTGISRNIAFAIHDGFPIRNRLLEPYYANLAGSLETAAMEKEYTLTLVGSRSREQYAFQVAYEILQQHRVDGVILARFGLTHETSPFAKATEPMPAVGVECEPHPMCPVVSWDEDGSVRETVQHLAALGHRNLLWVGPPDEQRETTLREQAGLANMRIAKAIHYERIRPVQPSPVEVVIDAVRPLAYNYLKSYKGKVTAAVCFNDNAAIGVYQAAAQLGISIPGKLSVVGFDDFLGVMLYPKLTTVSHRMEMLAKRAVDYLLTLIEFPKTRERLAGLYEVIPPELVVRDSTAPPHKP